MPNTSVRKATYRHSRNLLESTQVYFGPVQTDAPGTRIVRISRETWRPSFGIRARSPSGAMVAVVMGGHGTFAVDSTTHGLRPGDVFVLHPGRVFDVRGERRRPLDLLLVETCGLEAHALVSRHLPLAEQPFRPRSSHTVELLAQTIFEIALAGGDNAEDICRSLLLPLLMTVSDSLRSAEVPDSRARRTFLACKRHLDIHFHAMKSSAEAAAAESISQTYLEALFRRYAGQSPHRYLMGRKMDLAAHLLRTTDEPVKAIADQLGFSDQYVFSKAFKRTVGVAPIGLRGR